MIHGGAIATDIIQHFILGICLGTGEFFTLNQSGKGVGCGDAPAQLGGFKHDTNIGRRRQVIRANHGFVGNIGGTQRQITAAIGPADTEIEGKAGMLGQRIRRSALIATQAEIDELELHFRFFRPRQHAGKKARFRSAHRHLALAAQRPFQPKTSSTDRVRHDFIQRTARLGAIGEAHHEMILQILAHFRRIHLDLNAHFLKRIRLTNA